MKARTFATLALGLALAGAILAVPHILVAQPTMLPVRQGWDQATTTRYHHISQGAVIAPAAFMRALRTPSGEHFLDPKNMASYGFLPSSDGGVYPLGMAADDGKAAIENGIPMVGVNCAACHTGQLTVRGATLRVEGGSATLDITRFLTDVDKAIMADAKDPAKRKAFLAEAVADGYPASKASAGLDDEANRRFFMYRAAAKTLGANTPSGPGIVDALTGIAFSAMTTGLHEASNARAAKAPTNFPPVWDIWHFDWVQYNASVHQPMSRNVGEAIGLGVRLNIVDAHGRLNPASTRWKSTVNVKNLYWIENALQSLHAPAWPAAFGTIDQAKVAAGKALFAQNCSRCHGVNVVADSPLHEWHLPVVPLSRIGTDRNQAVGFAKTTYDATKIGASATEGGPEGLFVVVGNVKEQAYKDAGIPKSEWPKYDGYRKMLVGTACGYRPRPLVGIWSTPPFLHNGSVPSIYDMLSQTRPSRPIVGNTEFDPVKLGQVQVAIPGRTYTMDTALQGNSNAGHWFTNDTARKGRIGRALTESEKYDLIEYLKVADYADYPSRTIEASSIPAQPCAGDRDWAANIPY